ncbi:LacI family DNA-binding transcriptional regulator [Streptomyces sp. RTd22]|uniref:LacI family DNA-binding transcriptional regulator n=1 Tax=Streptomyces sp. RTd22 TaxID=1841249 RepID=UPI0007C4D341|nr:LacI family DNA-binding transcriptional regulator [Streptomyces sp. RTd22]
MPVPRKRPPTIADVARVARVSLPTVSRVLTGSVPVRDSTRDRVLAAIRELGYRPNGAARALVQGQQPIVGVVTHDTLAHGLARMIVGIEDQARRNGHVVAIAVLDPADPESTDTALDVLLAQPIVGVIVLDHHMYDAERLRARLGAVPVATVTSSDDVEAGVPHVLVDDRRAAKEITQHLLRLGHTTVHHVTVPGPHGGPQGRELGWSEALIEAGAPVPPVYRSDWSLESGLAAGAALARDGSATAVFCWNDELAFGVMRSLHEAGRRVPDDVSVVGIDDQPLARAWVPSLTTYRLDFDWAGRAAFELLVDPVCGVEAAGATSSGLIVRESTAPPAGH